MPRIGDSTMMVTSRSTQGTERGACRLWRPTISLMVVPERCRHPFSRTNQTLLRISFPLAQAVPFQVYSFRYVAGAPIPGRVAKRFLPSHSRRSARNPRQASTCPKSRPRSAGRRSGYQRLYDDASYGRWVLAQLGSGEKRHEVAGKKVDFPPVWLSVADSRRTILSEWL